MTAGQPDPRAAHGLPRAETLDVVCRRDLRAPMDDGVVLLADRWVAREAADRATAHRARALALRAAAVRGAALRTAAGRAGPAGGHPERARHVRLRRRRSAPSTSAPTGWPRCAGCARSRGTPGRSGRSAPATWASSSGRSPTEPATTWRRCRSTSPPRSSTPRPTPASSLSLETLASWLVIVAMQERRLGLLSIDRALRGLGAVVSRAAADLAGRARSPAPPIGWFQEALRQPGARGPLLGAPRLLSRGPGRHRARLVRRRLVRHPAALDAGRLRGAAGRRPRAAAADRALGPHLAGAGGGGRARRAGVDARPPARRRPARPRPLRCG